MRERYGLPVGDRAPMQIWGSSAAAEASCRRWNRNILRAVIVDGPCDDEYSVMDIADAIENGLLYRYAS